MKLETNAQFLSRLGRGLGFKLFISIVLGFFTSIGIVGLLGVSGGFLTATAIAGLTLATAEAFNVVIIPGLVRLLALVRTVGRYAERLSSHELTFRFLERLHLWIFDAFERLPAREALSIKSADVMERFTKDVHAIEHLIVRFLVPCGTAALLSAMLVATFALWYVEGLVLVVVMVAILLIVLPIVLFVWSRAISAIRQDLQSRLRFGLMDLVDNLEDFSIESGSYASQARLVGKLELEYAEVQTKLAKRLSLSKVLVICIIGILALALLVLLASNVALDDSFKVGLVFLFIGFGEIFAPIYQGFLDLSGANKSLGRIRSLESQSLEPADELGREAPPSGLAVSIEGLSFAYVDGQSIFQAFDLSIGSGEHVVLSGPSGGGKSTLVKILSGLEKGQGKVRVAAKVSCALQGPYVFMKTLSENLRLGNQGISDQKIGEIVEALELGPLISSFAGGFETAMSPEGATLSGGQKRRIGLARTLVQDADLYIVDEPTEGLDEEAGLRLASRVRELCKGKSLIWVSHRKAEFALFDRVITIG